MATIAINGFGRIGRILARVMEKRNKLVQLVAVNDLAEAEQLAHLLKYDSNYGPWHLPVALDKSSHEKAVGALKIQNHIIDVFNEKDPSLLPWKDLNVDIVVECSGHFTKKQAAAAHLGAGAKQVIISAPGSKDDPSQTSIIGVNANETDDEIINNGSCTTNCITPMIAVLEQWFGVEKAMMSTVHAYTADQNLQDAPHKDPRRARSAAENIVPTTTGAAIATTEAIPKIKDKFDGIAYRVPVQVGSISDVTAILKKSVTVEEIRAAFRAAEHDSKFAGVLVTSSEPLVSRDIVGQSASVIVDLNLIQVVDGNMVKIVGWYDNEWGYANRLADQIERIIKSREL